MFFGGSLGRHALAVDPLEEEVQHQGNHQQEHQGLDPFRRVQEQGMDGQGAFELVVGVFTVALLLVFRKQLVAAAWSRGAVATIAE